MTQIRNPLLLVFIFIAIGAYLRLSGLGSSDFAIDEYYFAKSIQSVAENGVPDFPNGGYYIRGILIQYITAPLIYIFNEIEFAVRLVPALLNLLSIPAVYLIGKKLGGSKAAILAVFFFTFSLWEIEFARFARMYAPFQFAFLWQLFFLVRYLQEGRNRDLNWIIGLTVLSTFIYAGAIFMVFVLIFALIFKMPQKHAYIYYLMSLVIVVASVVYFKIDFRNATSAPSSTTDAIDVGIKSLIYLPKKVFIDSGMEPISLAVFAIAVITTLFIIYKFNIHRIYRKLKYLSRFLLICFFGALLANQLLLSILLIPIFLLSCNVKIDRTLFSNMILFSFSTLLVWVLVWLGIAFIQSEILLTEIIANYFDFPNVKGVIAWPWIKAMPIHSILLFLVISIYLIPLLKDTYNGDDSVNRQYYILLISLIIVTSTLKTQYHTTRYTFYLYPLILILFSIALVKFDEVINIKIIKNKISYAFTLVFLMFSETYDLDHLLNINQPKYNYRVAYDQYRADLYFLRLDFRSVADFINKNIKNKDKIISLLPGVDYYLNKKLDFMYMREGKSTNVLSCNGNCFIWNGAPVILNQSDLLDKIENADGNLWLIANLKRYYPISKEEIYLYKHYANKIQHVNFDKSIVVYKF